MLTFFYKGIFDRADDDIDLCSNLDFKLAGYFLFAFNIILYVLGRKPGVNRLISSGKLFLIILLMLL